MRANCRNSDRIRLRAGRTAPAAAILAVTSVGLNAGAATPHPYLQFRTEATATTDLVRATRTADKDLSPRWTVVGVSQGGHAALNTGALTPTYAPELDFRGTAALAPPANVEQAIAPAGPYIPRVPTWPYRPPVTGSGCSSPRASRTPPSPSPRPPHSWAN
ncbi:lipase family protein [Nocardia sp. CA-120079]|uniref:lipase family protein n=1 Tax=Nocardia sp. CA-120079 TaxID=3239974 RepID=UPI003D998515